MIALPPAQGAPVSNRPGPYLSHSQQGPGHGRLDTARTWVQPPQAYRNIARSSAHSHPARHPRGHSCRLRGRGGGRGMGEAHAEVCAQFPHWPQSLAQSCQVCARPGPE